MNKMTQFSNRIFRSLDKHSPEILMGVGIAGMVTTTILAVKATPKALRLLELEKEDQAVESLSAKDAARTAWKCYIPAMGVGVASVICLIGASSVSARRNAALATAYSISETVLREYRDKVVETIGEKKEEEIHDAIAKDRVEKNPLSQNVVFIQEGNTLCYDALSGRYFKSDMEKLKRAANDLYRQMLTEDYVSLNEFYYLIGLPNIKIGDDIGWNVDNGPMDLSFSTQLADDNTPCLVLDYEIVPTYDYMHR